MRVVIYQDYLRSGGTEAQSLFLARRFRAAGDDVFLVTNRPGGSLSPQLSEARINHHCLQRWDTGLNWYAPSLAVAMRSLRPEVIVLMGRNANGTGAWLRRRFPGVLIVSTYRTGRRLPDAYRRSLRSAPLVICNSQYAAQQVTALGVEPAVVEVHPNACLRSDEIERMTADAADQQPGCNLLYLAAFVPGKNHRELLEMMPAVLRSHPTATLTLVGEGPTLKATRLLARQLGIEAVVNFTGYRRKVADLFANANVAVSPSLEESMPNALVEAQYAGLPVVAYDVAGVKECFQPGVSGLLISAGDSGAFIAAMTGLLADGPRRQAFSKAARCFARQQFHPDQRFDAFRSSLLRYLEPLSTKRP